MAGRPKRRARLAAGLPAEATQTNDPSPVHDAAEKRARGYVWETFESGNFVSLRHGANSQRVVGPLAEQLVEWLTAQYPDLAEPRYRFAVSAWARAETRVALLSFYLAQHLVDESGRPRERLLRELRSEESRAAKERANLGLDAMNHALLERARADAVASAFDLDAALTKGREVIEGREVRALPDVEDAT